ncbi:sulfotransferase domain-containing protein [Aliikangiella coralliicola]|uniref:Sulfotransferase domain-containing protein n=1 Tax=Aliikangiella coralliicola TaxID=2592383 RepID=A0A545TSM3_9GAMM|nr:sulfotransferase domain-containing protein [Aliikangiella coralliicola]TQV80220.1 sulfotransferase domain-containing protein [Aliikangiella coralliicola]
MPKSAKVPLFVVAGMPRGATTFLYHYLSQHPEIFLPFRKEINYFNVKNNLGIDWYLSLYREMDSELIAGDISPLCFFNRDSISEIKAYSKEVKVILVIRDPAEWAVSFYYQFKSFTNNMPSLNEFLTKGHLYNVGDEQLFLKFSGNWIGERIKEYQAEFGDNVLIYNFSYFKKNPLNVLKTIEQFLDISNYFTSENFDNRRINESKRRNIRLVSWLLSRELVINTIGKLVPRKLIMKLRALFDRISSKNRGESSKNATHTDRDIEIASEFFREDTVKVSELFKESPVLIGLSVEKSSSKSENNNE